ncbi:MAG: GTP 3',8-cyclase MoaA [Lentisphaerae bacterium]|nr:GTP 3',8-cyclase MoaA [Lentisphaerota bacterium]
MIASLDKPDLSIRISVTDRCPLRCRYCMPPEGVPLFRHEDILSFEEIVSFVERLQELFDVKKIRLTGGDPLARRGMPELVALLSRLAVQDLAMTTNVQYLAERAGELFAAGLHRANISVDSLDADTFRDITHGGDLHRTLAGIDAALRVGLSPVKLNAVVMKDINDQEVCDLLSFALERGCEMRFLELMPIGYGAGLFDRAFVSTASVRRSLASRFELEPLCRADGSSARRYRVRATDGLNGIVGFISPCSNPFCYDCTRLRLTANGRLIGCLARGENLDIRPCLADTDGNALGAAVRNILQCKRSDACFKQPAPMAVIGG